MIIGVFVPDHSADSFQQLLRTYKNVQFEFYSYQKLEEVINAYEKNAPFLDGYFFSGALSYRIIEEKFGNFDKPVTFLKISEADFYKKLFHIILDNPTLTLSRVFLDFHFESKEIANFVENLPPNQRPLLISNEENILTEDVYERLFDTHEQLYTSGKIDLSFTRFANIVDHLEEKNYPYYYFDISKETIHHTLMNLITEINLNVLKENQIACGYLKINLASDDVKEIKLLNLHSLLLDFNHKHQNQLVIRKVNDVFEITTNYNTIEQLTNNFSACSLLHDISLFIKEPIHIGWGIGKSLIQAQTNAKKACDYSINNHISSTYIAENDNKLIGPLVGGPLENYVDVNLLEKNHLEQLQQKLDMTRDKLHKIILAFTQAGNNQVSSAFFAESLGISIRSANRILKEAEEKGLVIAELDTDSGLQGRPKKIYHLNRDVF